MSLSSRFVPSSGTRCERNGRVLPCHARRGIPYPRHRWAVADLVGVEECDLWPELDQRRRTAGCGLVAMYPTPLDRPAQRMATCLPGAEQEIDILAYSGLFLAEDAGIRGILSDRANAGVRVCVLLGDPDDLHVADRGAEEGLGADVMAARIRNALTLYRPLREVEGVELRLHRSPLYASIYRADADVMVNPHIYATPAAQAPILHFRTTEEGGPANAYLDAFENVWTEARPVTNVR